MIKKYLQDYFSYQISHIFGGRKYEDWAGKNLVLLQHVPIQNKKLAQEFEVACKKNGFLTYFEFLTIDQFGTYGYHSTYKQHGMTDVKFRWPEALATLCKQKGFHSIVEFGPGDGEVGVKTLLEAKKQKYELFWSGVEIGEDLKEKARKLFRKKGLEKHLTQLVTTLQELSLKEKCLFVFSYSLDNLIPDVYINTTQKKGFPNAMVGVTVKNGMLSEVLLPMKAGSLPIGLSSWQLNPMQRAYVPLDVCRILYQTTELLPLGSQILIVDEFRLTDNFQQLPYHLGLPRDLETFSRDFTDFEKFYRTAGSNLLYFPMFIDSTIDFLSQLGFTLEEKSGEHKLAFTLSGRNNPLPKHPRTLALLTSPKKNSITKKQFIFSAPVA